MIGVLPRTMVAARLESKVLSGGSGHRLVLGSGGRLNRCTFLAGLCVDIALQLEASSA